MKRRIFSFHLSTELFKVEQLFIISKQILFWKNSRSELKGQNENEGKDSEKNTLSI